MNKLIICFKTILLICSWHNLESYNVIIDSTDSLVWSGVWFPPQRAGLSSGIFFPTIWKVKQMLGHRLRKFSAADANARKSNQKIGLVHSQMRRLAFQVQLIRIALVFFRCMEVFVN